MNTNLIRITKKSFDILFWIGVIATFFVVVAVTLAIVSGDLESVGGGVVIDGTFTQDASNMDIRTARLLLGGLGLATVLTLLTFLYIAHKIRLSLGSILEGNAFRNENYGRLRSIATAVFALAGVEIASVLWAGAVADGALNIEIPVGTLVTGLLVLSIAEIYKAGISLQDEAELTV